MSDVENNYSVQHFTKEDLMAINKAIVEQKIKYEDASVLLFGHITEATQQKCEQLIAINLKINSYLADFK